MHNFCFVFVFVIVVFCCLFLFSFCFLLRCLSIKPQGSDQHKFIPKHWGEPIDTQPCLSEVSPLFHNGVTEGKGVINMITFLLCMSTITSNVFHVATKAGLFGSASPFGFITFLCLCSPDI